MSVVTRIKTDDVLIRNLTNLAEYERGERVAAIATAMQRALGISDEIADAFHRAMISCQHQ